MVSGHYTFGARLFRLAFCAVCVLLASPLRAQAANSPVPLIYQPLTPASAVPGSGSFTLTVRGTGFVSNSVVNWNGSPRTTTFVNGEQLTATVNAADVAVAATASITVTNPAPGGGTSNVVFLPITNTTASVTATLTSSPAVGHNPNQVVVADFDGDRIQDIAVANPGTGTVSILKGNGDGTFTALVSPAVPNAFSLAVGDFNGDGKLDLAVLNNGGGVTILLGNGNGTFNTGSSLPTGTDPVWIAAGDFNGDGALDLAVVNNVDNTLTILLGDGAGNFKSAPSPSTGRSPRSVVVGDFNGDGKLDLAVSNQLDNTVTILLGNGDGTFTPTGSVPTTGPGPFQIVVADFDNDGKLDLAVVNQTGLSSHGTLTILKGDGAGNFTTVSSPSVGIVPVDVAVGDLNGDGNLDLVVTSECGSFSCPQTSTNGNGTITILLGDGKGNFATTATLNTSTGSFPIFVALGDFNGDGRLDFVTSEDVSDTVSVFLQPRPAAASSTTTGISAPAVTYGSSGSVTVTVTSSGGTPTGSVSLTVDGSASPITQTLSALGSSTFTLSGLAAGTHSLAASYSPTGNFAASTATGTLTVKTASLTITANDATKILDAPNPSFAATYSGFVNGDGPGSLIGTLSCTTTATATSPVGSYPITCSGQSSPNYTIAYVAGNLRVLYAPLGTLCDGDAGHSILAPISALGASVFKQGSTVPAKFRVCDASGVSIGTPGVVSSFLLTQIIAGTATDVNESVSSTNPDTAFRFDSVSQQWIFNTSTSNLAAGATYVFTISLNDGTVINFQYGLK